MTGWRAKTIRPAGWRAEFVRLLFGFLFRRSFFLRLLFGGFGLRRLLRSRGLFRRRLLLRLLFRFRLLGGRRFGGRSSLLRLRLLLRFRGGGRLGLQLEADQLEDRHLGSVTAARSELDDAGVAARTLRETRAERAEQLRHERVVGDDAAGLTAGVDA